MLKYLKPQLINSPKVRLGNQSDGGYVVPELVLETCVALFTYGYGGDKTYEDDFIAKYNKPNYLFDHTVHQDNWDNGLQHFFAEGLGSSASTIEKERLYFGELYDRKDTLNKAFDELNEDQSATNVRKYRDILNTVLESSNNLINAMSVKDVREHYDRFGIEGDIFLKIDTEGAEYDYFLNVDVDDLASFTNGLVVEFHWIDQPDNQTKLVQILEKLDKHFILVHVHGNNWGGEFDYEGHKVPRVPELSFINRKYVTEYTPDNQDYPVVGVDFPNNPSLDECDLSFLKQF